ncbi:MAG: reverse transcriptase-like protein, partial [Candidatus Dormibacteraceae bacterium]
ELVVKQLKGLYKIKNSELQGLAAEAKKLLEEFTEVRLTHIPRERNRAADALANQAMDRAGGKRVR